MNSGLEPSDEALQFLGGILAILVAQAWTIGAL
jgi:hypothetical protein